MASIYTAREVKNTRTRDVSKQIELDLRAMLSSFYWGTWSHDIGNVLSFLGVQGGNLWDNVYFGTSEQVNDQIIQLCGEIIEEGLKMEIQSNIE